MRNDACGKWLPRLVNWSCDGGLPEVRGTWTKISGLVFVTVLIIPPSGATVESVAGNSWIENLPFKPSCDSAMMSAADDNFGTPLGAGSVLTNGKMLTPTLGPLSHRCVLSALFPVDGAARPRRIGFIGDSLTADWPLYLYLENAINFGIGGDSPSNQLARIAGLIALAPDLIVIWSGTAAALAPDISSIATIESMAELVAAAGIPVVLLTIPPWGDEAVQYLANYPNVTIAMINARVVTHNAELKTMAASHGWPVCDLYAAMSNPDGSRIARDTYDGLHPNGTLSGPTGAHPGLGYDVLWPVLQPFLLQGT